MDKEELDAEIKNISKLKERNVQTFINCMNDIETINVSYGLFDGENKQMATGILSSKIINGNKHDLLNHVLDAIFRCTNDKTIIENLSEIEITQRLSINEEFIDTINNLGGKYTFYKFIDFDFESLVSGKCIDDDMKATYWKLLYYLKI